MFNGKNRENQDVERPLIASRLTLPEKKQMMACILARKDLFVHARMHLKPEHFDQPDEMALRVLWMTALRVVENFGVDSLFADRTQAWNLMDTEGQAVFREQPDAIEAVAAELFHSQAGFLAWSYGACKPEEFVPGYGMHKLVQFLKERVVNDPLRRLTQSAAGGVITNAAAIAKQLAQKDVDISLIGSDPVESGAPAGWLPPIPQKRPTGITWLDLLLNGGHRPPEVYGVTGAIGAGKTTFGLQLGYSVATQELFLADKTASRAAREALGMDVDMDYEAGGVYYFHYEMSKDDIRKKLWSSASMIHLDRIELMGMEGFSLSDEELLSDQDRAVLSIASSQSGLAGRYYPSERQRLQAAVKVLERNLFTIDMSGSDPKGSRSRGTGFIPEIEAILSNEVNKGRRIAVVIIDYAMACVERHTSDERKIYPLLSQFGRRCEHEIGVPFNTPVWVLQQLSGAANARSAASKPHHADAMGSRRFAENCWFGFNIGTSDETTGCRYFTVSKARRADLGRPPVLKIAGGYNRLIDVSSQYHFDGRGRAVLNQKPSMHPK